MERPPIAIGGTASVAATVSGGLVVMAPEDCAGGLSPALERADAALYRAKAEGRNRIAERLIGQAAPSATARTASETCSSYWPKFSTNMAASRAACTS